MLEALFIGFVFVMVLALFMAREWGKSSAHEDESQADLKAVHNIIKEASDADKLRQKAINDTIRGVVPDRLRKHYRN